MNGVPTFSVATPTRNALAKLRRCVGSVRGQAGVTVEHLVQDADSVDGTPQWLQKQSDLAAISEPDAGMYDAIERAWRRSRGRYLSWLNADEQYLPGTLALVQRWFESHPDDSVLFGDYIVTRGDGSAVALRREIPFRRAYVVNGFLNCASCTLFFRRELLDSGLLRFEPGLRYAADKGLMLQLHQAGVRIAHLSTVLSVFGIDGSNLSTHPQMAEEAELVRREHGALRSQSLRRLVMLGRSAERLLRGSYQRRDVQYAYALDEVPTYRAFEAQGIGGRYSLADGGSPSASEA